MSPWIQLSLAAELAKDGIRVNGVAPGVVRTLPYVNMKITREGGTTAEQKADLIAGVTDLMVRVLDKSPTSAMVVIDEVELANWGIGGLPVVEYRQTRAAASSD